MKSEDTILRYDETTDSDGNVTRTFENGNKMVMNSEGKVISTIKYQNGKEIKTEIEYDGNKKIEKETIDGKFSSITVSENKDGHTVDTKYTSKEDFDNNKPSEEIIDTQNPTLKKVTKFSYDSKGNVKAETTDAAGNTTTTFKDSEGKEIKAEDFDKQEQETTPEIAGTYTVKKGEGINKIVSDALKAQGIENPTKEEFQKAKEEFLELNKDMVKIYHGKRKEWHGNKFFYVDDEVKIPKFKPTEATEETKPEDAPKPDETQQSPKEELKKQLQDKLGENYLIELDADGKIIIKNKDGLIYPKASNFVNNPNFDPNSLDLAQDGSLVIKGKNGDVLPEATKKANDAVSDDEEINQIMTDGDKDNNKKLDKNEYKNYILNMLKEYNITIENTNRATVEKLIEESFDGIDVTESDGQLSLGELNKKAKEIIEKLTEDLESVLNKTEPKLGE